MNPAESIKFVISANNALNDQKRTGNTKNIMKTMQKQYK